MLVRRCFCKVQMDGDKNRTRAQESEGCADGKGVRNGGAKALGKMPGAGKAVGMAEPAFWNETAILPEDMKNSRKD